MIYKGKLVMTVRYYGSKAVVAVYKGARLVWEAVSSCFGGGMWMRDRAWKDTDGWKE